MIAKLIGVFIPARCRKQKLLYRLQEGKLEATGEHMAEVLGDGMQNGLREADD